MESKIIYSSILSVRAEKEMSSSWDWYEERQKGLGDRFIEEVIRKISIVEDNPELFPVKYKSYRETMIATFPMLIIYRINKRKRIIRIVSVFHTARSIKAKYQ